MSIQSPTLNVSILSKDASALAEEIANAWPEPHALNICQAVTTSEQINPDEVEVLLADPNLAAKVIDQCTGLKWCQSTWAGNAPLINLDKSDYILTGVKGVFGNLMREYVFAYLLQYARNIPAFAHNQNHQPPIWEESPRAPLTGKTLGILGAGSIAKALIPVAKSFEMKVIGLSRSGQAVGGFDDVYSATDLLKFAQEADHVVNLMPDTPATTGVLNQAFFGALKPHSVFINAGRGSAVINDALLNALNNGTLQAAVLDVFTQEPLPKEHPFWTHPKVVVTAHTAAVSSPEDVAGVFITNAIRYMANEPLYYQFNFNKGY
ncbi:D-2-hydroxyacid dehydrogenase [Alteromonas sp. 38]|uniref:D-2-hydroxyacid dehydrogenase n=1 Tax=Alteromonas TaxID=226 RepID=UPI0012F0C016|nr:MULTISPECIES: D-2-hydroxyacid dehydrogenase [Alteromonas]CAD5261468.1 D-2-hydroxyacid dehydrogenase [Alteromonas sp. 154]VXC28141.1 D-2-hydroxyacid dehydrogenase [Alteromonas sp. 38]